MGVCGRISTRLYEREGKEAVAINISTDDAKILIGQAGENLIAFQRMARLLFRKQNKEQSLPFVIDVNNYRREKEERLKSLARSAALKVRRTKEKEVLRPMSAYDRRIVHTFLAGEEDLATESVGDEPERKVVVKLVNRDGQSLIRNS
jgi:spoIIIJ-associated protein